VIQAATHRPLSAACLHQIPTQKRVQLDYLSAGLQRSGQVTGGPHRLGPAGPPGSRVAHPRPLQRAAGCRVPGIRAAGVGRLAPGAHHGGIQPQLHDQLQQLQVQLQLHHQLQQLARGVILRLASKSRGGGGGGEPGGKGQKLNEEEIKGVVIRNRMICSSTCRWVSCRTPAKKGGYEIDDEQEMYEKGAERARKAPEIAFFFQLLLAFLVI